MTEPFVEIKIDFPSGENFRPVHSISLLSATTTMFQSTHHIRRHSVPCSLKDEKGPLSKDLRSYSFTDSELMPAAKMRPSGSKAATGRPDSFIRPWQWLERRSHSLMDLSKEPDKKDHKPTS